MIKINKEFSFNSLSLEQKEEIIKEIEKRMGNSINIAVVYEAHKSVEARKFSEYDLKRKNFERPDFLIE